MEITKGKLWQFTVRTTYKILIILSYILFALILIGILFIEIIQFLEPLLKFIEGMSADYDDDDDDDRYTEYKCDPPTRGWI